MLWTLNTSSEGKSLSFLSLGSKAAARKAVSGFSGSNTNMSCYLSAICSAARPGNALTGAVSKAELSVVFLLIMVFFLRAGELCSFHIIGRRTHKLESVGDDIETFFFFNIILFFRCWNTLTRFL